MDRVVTIDGPAASGKTSVSREVARRLGWRWVSTGAFYRGLAFVARQLHTDLKNEQAVVDVALSPVWEVRLSPERTLVFMNDEDVTDEIYREEMGEYASLISQYPKVRANLLEAQRRCYKKGAGGLVAEGRDCGTVVFPHAPVKIYLEAATVSRAERRALEEGKSVDETRASQARRDRQDSTRKTAPLQRAKEAHLVDTSDMNLEEVVDYVEGLIRKDLKI
ncbi:MAG: (d)CMP kinase [Bdellovibrionales bacterium]|nr:(d)CMP kinase [Bdellovibrionales bacterium]